VTFNSILMRLGKVVSISRKLIKREWVNGLLLWWEPQSNFNVLGWYQIFWNSPIIEKATQIFYQIINYGCSASKNRVKLFSFVKNLCESLETFRKLYAIFLRNIMWWSLCLISKQSHHLSDIFHFQRMNVCFSIALNIDKLFEQLIPFLWIISSLEWCQKIFRITVQYDLFAFFYFLLLLTQRRRCS